MSGRADGFHYGLALWRAGYAAGPAGPLDPDMLNILDAIGKAGASFKSLGDTWADTTTPHGRLM
jgi:hypothetical protein